MNIVQNLFSNLSSTPVPDHILAFRTITSLLSKIQQADASQIIDDSKSPEKNSLERQELKILSALASFLVMDNEVIAVATKRIFDDTGKSSVEVIISTHADNSPLISPPQSSNLGGIVRYLLSKNPRTEDTIITMGPGFVEPTCPPDFISVEQWIKDFWFNIPLNSHVCLLTKMLNDKTLELTLYYFYVTSTCIRKICRRFNHPLSKPYFTALTSITNVTFTPKFTKTQVVFEKKMDMAALKWIEHTLTPEKLAEFPVLAAKAKAIKMDDNLKDFQLYTAKTCQEYHNFLCHLLQSFSTCLLFLNRYAKNTLKSRTGSGTAAINATVRSTTLYALALQDIVTSPAFMQHIRNIEVPLKQALIPFRSRKVQVETEDDQDFDELRAIQPLHTLPEVYERWMKLVLTHYDAAKILFNYVASPGFQGNVVEMKILDTPMDNKATMTLPWRELFPSEEPTKYIPASSSPDEPSNGDICKFLQDGVKINFERNKSTILNLKARFQQLHSSNPPNPHHIDKLVTAFSNSCVELSAWSAASQDITQLLEEMKGSEAVIDKLCQSIERIFDALLTSISFFEYLKAMKFTGRDHCEVSLAGLLAFSLTDCKDLDPSIEDIVQKLKDYRRIIGVSKQCCPVCRSILFKLLPKEAPFVVRGSHNTYYPCSIATWFPKIIVDQMIFELGVVLRSELVGLMERSGLYCPRPQSTGSDRLSSESHRESVVSPQLFQDMKESVSQTQKLKYW